MDSRRACSDGFWEGGGTPCGGTQEDVGLRCEESTTLLRGEVCAGAGSRAGRRPAPQERARTGRGFGAGFTRWASRGSASALKEGLQDGGLGDAEGPGANFALVVIYGRAAMQPTLPWKRRA